MLQHLPNEVVQIMQRITMEINQISQNLPDFSYHVSLYHNRNCHISLVKFKWIVIIDDEKQCYNY
jgi:hypothetical protein